jgi:hypothetical protein
MKPVTRWTVAVAVAFTACLSGAVYGADPVERAEEAARARNKGWNPATVEVALIQVGKGEPAGALKNFCLDVQGNILACYAPHPAGLAASGNADHGPGIRVYSPDGKLVKTLPLEIKPGAVCVIEDGSIFVAGDGKLLKLDAAGKVLASAPSPVAAEPVVITKEMESQFAENARLTKRSINEVRRQTQTALEDRRKEVNGLAATDQDVFMTVGAPSDFSFRVYRFDHALQNPKLVVDKLRGCCSTMDVQAHGDKLFVAHNARHKVEVRDRDGVELSKFGTKGKVKASDFGGCCEPKCLRVLPGGDILAAESGPPTCIKRFSPTGEFIEVVAVVPGAKGDCVRVTVAASPDGSRYYMLDTTKDAIRVFAAKDHTERADARGI